jgi:hypothetical protein
MRTPSFVLLTVTLSTLAFACGGDSGPTPGGPPVCTGAGCGSCEATDCACNGTERCEAVCSNECDLTCSGSGGCAGECGNDCNFTCSGTDQCNVAVGARSSIVCSGTHGCVVECVGGDCNANCSGTDGCAIVCPDGGCTVDCEGRTVEECADGTLACARPCPE